MTPLIPVILSGGAGTRLWPQSRQTLPKPFMRLPDGRSLFRRTYDRAVGIEGCAQPVIVTHRDHYFQSCDELAPARAGSQLAARFLLEPVPRNTAPAIALATLAVAQWHGPEALVLALPADHLIADEAAFRAAVRAAAAAAGAGRLVTFGIEMTRPATGYGYIEAGASLGPDVFAVQRFIEKPDAQTAEAFMRHGGFFWNSGMFVFRAADMLTALDRHCPALLTTARNCWLDSQRGSAIPGAVELSAPAFESFESISIDYAVFERASGVAMVPGGFGWSDVGIWTEMAAQFAADPRGNRAAGDAVFVDSDDCFVHGGHRLVATLGLRGVCMIDTPDALLVLDAARAQDVRQVVDLVRARGGGEHEHHLTANRPWGSFTVLNEGPGFKIKRVEVHPGAALSLQFHRYRSEHWVVVAGEAWVTNGDRSYSVGTNESTFIAAGTPHRLENKGDSRLVVIEVQSGSHVGEDDIVRLEDRYGRAGHGSS